MSHSLSSHVEERVLSKCSLLLFLPSKQSIHLSLTDEVRLDETYERIDIHLWFFSVSVLFSSGKIELNDFAIVVLCSSLCLIEKLTNKLFPSHGPNRSRREIDDRFPWSSKKTSHGTTKAKAVVQLLSSEQRSHRRLIEKRSASLFVFLQSDRNLSILLQYFFDWSHAADKISYECSRTSIIKLRRLPFHHTFLSLFSSDWMIGIRL